MNVSTFVHQWIAAENVQHVRTLLLLHGTGGDENSLLELGCSLSPGANLLSPRGPVLEHGMPRFFRRFAEGVFDEADIRARAQELAQFIADAAQRYDFDAGNVVAVGYSNGANTAAALLLLHPQILRGAVLLRAMTPLVPNDIPSLNDVEIFLASGERDRLVPRSDVENLARMLRDAGAAVTHRWHNGGHELAREEINAARDWLQET